MGFKETITVEQSNSCQLNIRRISIVCNNVYAISTILLLYYIYVFIFIYLYV